VRLAVKVEIFDFDFRRPLDLLVIFRDRQAALFVSHFVVGRPGHFRIDENARVVLVGLLRQIHGDDAFGNADLDRGKADAGRVIHGRQHVIDQLADAGIDVLDRLGNLPQPLVGERYDLAHSHGGRCKG